MAKVVLIKLAQKRTDKLVGIKLEESDCIRLPSSASKAI